MEFDSKKTGKELKDVAWYYPKVITDKAKNIEGYVAFCMFFSSPSSPPRSSPSLFSFSDLFLACLLACFLTIKSSPYMHILIYHQTD